MMRWIVGLLFCCVAATALADMKAVTDEGDVVILKNDGTWRYEDKVVAENFEIKSNPTKFNKLKDSTFQLKSTKNSAVFWINPKKWSFEKSGDGSDPSEYVFKLKDSDLYGMAITEQLEVDVVELTKIALDNAKDAAPDAKITKREYRTVNGHKVIYMEMAGTIQSIKFTYLGYYYSDQSGSTQLVTYTGSNLVTKYRKDIEAFLNGFSSR